MPSPDNFTQLHLHFHSRTTQPADWTEQKHHPDHDLWVLVSGRLHLASRGESWTLKPGDGFHFPPRTPYTASGGGRPSTFHFIHFGFPALGETPGSLRAPIRIDANIFKLAWKNFDSCWQKRQRPFSPLELRGAFTVVMAQILRHLEKGPGPGRSQTHLARKLDPVIAHMERRLSEPPSNSELAGLTGMTVPYFTALFRQVTGLPPHHFFQGLRLGKAKDLLLEGRSVVEVGSILGFPDSPTFSKAFKKHFGISPGSFAGRK